MSQEVLPSAAETFYVVAGVDYGTQSDVIKVQLFDGEKSFGPPFFIQECLGLYAIPAQAAYHEGALYTGWELDDHIRGLKEPTIPSDAVLRDEEYEPSVHVDAWVMKNQKRMPIDGVVHRSEWNPKRRFVLQRMFPFLKQGDSTTTTDIDTGGPVYYYMRARGKLHLKSEFVLINEEKLHPFMKTGSDTELAFDGGAHGPAFEKDGKTPRPGVTPWKKTVRVLKLSKNELASFNQLLDTDGSLWYEVRVQLCVTYRSEKDMVMKWRLLPPYGEPIEVEERESLLWDAEHSEFFENPVSDAEEDGEE
ncbi:hypothetical protein D0863_08695 [Hortaea werneckii]|uniref:Uncharacterized protein n=1 Tax=Hortaea werneckii TaxID=91943 RepID=A0A3M7DP05_HORWE|nr:hypothetical protein D0863_08695 [Hortaea werneckii]